MKNRGIRATVASVCTLGLLVGAGTIAFVGSAEAASNNKKYAVSLTGAQEVFPPGGDADGTGAGTVKVKGKTSTVCVTLKKIANIGPATAAHIHKAAVGVDGPIVVFLATPTQVGKKYQKSKSCAVVSATLLGELQNTPSLFYLNVHNGAFPGGAIRGQLPIS